MQADHAEICRLLKTARGQIDGILKMIDVRTDTAVDICLRRYPTTEAVLKKSKQRNIKLTYEVLCKGGLSTVEIQMKK